MGCRAAPRSKLSAAALAAVALGLAAAPLGAGDTMKMSAETIAVPRDDQPRKLERLSYTTRAWVSELTAVRAAAVPDADAREVTWVLTVHSTRPKLQKIAISLSLENAAGERIATASKSLVLSGGAAPSEHKVDMKLKPGVWAQADKLRLEARFATL